MIGRRRDTPVPSDPVEPIPDSLAVGPAQAVATDVLTEPNASGTSEGRRVGIAWQLLYRALVRNPRGLIGSVIVIVVIAFCFIGPLLDHTDQIHVNPLLINQAPSASHPLGTDNAGHDMLGRLMVGGQSSIEIGLAVAVLSTLFGVAWGAVSGYKRGLVDIIMMRVVDIFLAIPAIFIFIYLATIYRPTVGLLIIVVASLSWVGAARLVRAETLSLREREFVEVAQVQNASPGWIIVRHIIPNALGTILVNATFQIADAILVLAALSFLGFGLPPPAATWGGILANGTTYLVDGYWWQIYPAGLLIVITVVGFNFVGDALRDTLDVRNVRRW